MSKSIIDGDFGDQYNIQQNAKISPREKCPFYGMQLMFLPSFTNIM